MAIDSQQQQRPGKVAVMGGGPAGMAAALGMIAAGHSVTVYERYKTARPAGNILNLWPPPIKALQEMGVDIKDLGYPCSTEFRNTNGYTRARVDLPENVIRDYGGGFIGMLRPDLYKRMLASIPAGVMHFGQDVVDFTVSKESVKLHFADGRVEEVDVLIGADGIDSAVRKHLWGDSPKRLHNLHVIGGFTFDSIPGAERGEVVLTHSRTVQGTYSSILSEGREGYQWWVLEAWPDHSAPPDDLHKHATALGGAFSSELQEMIRSTRPQDTHRWPIRDRQPLTQWSKGRVTLSGDAAHPTSPYAAYGAGMSICDGYYLGQVLAGLDLKDTGAVESALTKYDSMRIPHTTEQVQTAYYLGRLFHHTPWPLTYLRDLVLDHTPLLQRQVGDKNPTEIVAQLAEMGSGIRMQA